jgi:hypothetical protein
MTREVININDTYESDENLYDNDECNYDEKYLCQWCGARLIKGNEKFSAYGSDFSISVWECPECG